MLPPTLPSPPHAAGPRQYPPHDFRAFRDGRIAARASTAQLRLEEKDGRWIAHLCDGEGKPIMELAADGSADRVREIVRAFADGLKSAAEHVQPERPETIGAVPMMETAHAP